MEPRTTGELCVGGDWACAHGDFGALRWIAEELAARLPEPTHCRLVELAGSCASDPRRAGELWMELKPIVVGWLPA
jgi:hypothetical protein